VGAAEIINATEEEAPNKGADDTKRPKKGQSPGVSNRIARQPMQNRCKTVDCPEK
jgi:hypothetical protein